MGAKRCRDCVRKFQATRIVAYEQVKVSGLIPGTEEFTRQLRRVENKMNKVGR